MVEIRVVVAERAVHLLMRRLVDVFGRAAVSFDSAREEVRVFSDWGSRAVDHVVAEVEAVIVEAGVPSARLAIGEAAYTVVAPLARA